MILQALYDYYLRRQADADPDRRLPAFGLEQKEIGFILEVDESGQLQAIIDARQMSGKKKIGTSYLVPKGVKKTSGIAANLLWDNAEYVLTIPDVKKLDLARAKGGAEEYLVRLIEMQQAFRDRISTLPELAQSDAGLRGVLAFLDTNPAEQVVRFAAHAEIAASNPVLTFRLINDTALVCQRPGVAPHLVVGAPDGGATEECDGLNAMCLITGDTLPVERLHTAIKGVWGAQTSGANIVSFNLDAFNSYGKSQGANAPVSQAAAFAYTTALNALLARDSSQRVQVGDASTVFWAQKSDTLEHELAALLGGGDNPDAHTQQVKGLFDSVHSGSFTGARGDNAFYVLGLAPNAARIAVRFWYAAPLRDIASNIAMWFNDLAVVRGKYDFEHPGLKPLLRSVVLLQKDENVPPGLGGDVMRAIFSNGPLPTTLLNLAIHRCRAGQDVTYLRAAVIKACLNRASRYLQQSPKEFTVMLDTQNTRPSYRLGRLFAVLEKIQEESSGGQLNSTIRDRYYGAACSSPATVFPTLLKLKNHHVRKLDEKGRRMLYRAFQDNQPDDYIGQVLQNVYPLPAHLSLQEQGSFALGYYHQRQEFFTKREAADAESTALDETTH